MSWLGDVGSFEAFNAKGMLNQIKDKPQRLLYGSADPFSTKVWNGVLGTDDKPIIDQWGGAADQRYDEAEDAGINTGPGKTMHGIAKVIAGIFTGNAASGAMGGAGGASSAGSSAATTGGTGYGMGSPVVSGGVGNASYASAAPASSGGFSGAMSTAKPYMDAAKTGMEVSGAMNPQQQQIQPSPVAQRAPSSSDLANLYATLQQGQLSQAQASEAARANRRGLLRGNA